MVKPQFEAARADVGEGGVVDDPAVQDQAVARVGEALEVAGFEVLGTCASEVRGKKKHNQEFFVIARRLGR